jgi:VirE N-terminal domain
MNAINLSYGHSITNSNVTPVSLNDIIVAIKWDADLKNTISKIRATDDINHRQQLKRQLPYLSFCSFKDNLRSNNNFLSTQFLVFDADHVVDLTGLRQRVEADPEVFMAFKSPSGDGLKFVVRLDTPVTDQSTYRKMYAAKVEEYGIRFGGVLDGTTNDPARATFLSHDEDLYVNPDSTPVYVTKGAQMFILVLVL